MAVTPADVTRVLKHYVYGRPTVALSTVPNGKLDQAAKDTPFPAPVNEGDLSRSRAPTKPRRAARPPFHSPVVWHETTDKGVPIAGVVWNERPLSTLTVSVPAGRTHESFEKLGLSSLVASMLQQGTQTLDAVGWVRELDRLARRCRRPRATTRIKVTLSCLDPQFPDAREALHRRDHEAALRSGRFRALKKERTTALETRGDQIRTIAGTSTAVSCTATSRSWAARRWARRLRSRR
jgi:zinc protease